MRQTEVRDMRAAVRVQQHVGRLDVAMHDAHAVRVVQRLGQVADGAGRLAEIDRPLLDQLRQGAPSGAFFGSSTAEMNCEAMK